MTRRATVPTVQKSFSLSMSTEKPKQPLHKITEEGDLEELCSLLERPEEIDINEHNWAGVTALHLAVNRGNIECIEKLLKVPSIDVDRPDVFYQRTPLMLAARTGNKTIMELLISAKADINSQNMDGETPLMKCCCYGHVRCVRLLVKNQASIDTKNKYGLTALHLAADNGWKSICSILIKGGGSSDIQDSQSMTPLQRVELQIKKMEQLMPQKKNSRQNHKNNLTKEEEERLSRLNETRKFLRAVWKKKTMELLTNKEIQKWTSEDVGLWLEVNGFRVYKDAFARSGITGPLIQNMSEQLLSTVIPNQWNGTNNPHHLDVKKKLMERIGTLSSHHTTHESTNANKLPTFTSEIPFSELTISDRIDGGFFGEVSRGFWRGTSVAIKILYHNLSSKSMENFEKEVSMLSNMRHPNIIRFIGTSNSNGKHCILTQYLPKGNLHTFIRDNFNYMDHFRKCSIISDICKGMCYLHGFTPKPIIHRDLTSRNVLLDENLTAVICDFGLSRFLDDTTSMTAGVGNVAWVAPEVWKGQKYDEKCDVFSFSMILYEIFTGREPSYLQNPMEYVHKVAYSDFRPELPPKDLISKIFIDEQYTKLIRTCWHTEPSIRPTFQEILGLYFQVNIIPISAEVFSASNAQEGGAYL